MRADAASLLSFTVRLMSSWVFCSNTDTTQWQHVTRWE